MEGDESQASVYVLRRLLPSHWKKDKPTKAAFRLRPGEVGLSVYSTDLATPRRLLRDYLDGCLMDCVSRNEDTRARAEERLAKHGKTVEEMYEKGWRVARVPMAAFDELGLVVEPPNPDDEGDQIGHCLVPGTEEQFEQASAVLKNRSDLLTEAETLA